MQTKAVEQLAIGLYPAFSSDIKGLMPATILQYNRQQSDKRAAFIAGYTAAQSEQSEMVKKSEVVNVIKDALSYFNNTGPIGTQLTDLLTKLKEL